MLLLIVRLLESAILPFRAATVRSFVPPSVRVPVPRAERPRRPPVALVKVPRLLVRVKLVPVTSSPKSAPASSPWVAVPPVRLASSVVILLVEKAEAELVPTPTARVAPLVTMMFAAVQLAVLPL